MNVLSIDHQLNTRLKFRLCMFVWTCECERRCIFGSIVCDLLISCLSKRTITLHRKIVQNLFAPYVFNRNSFNQNGMERRFHGNVLESLWKVGTIVRMNVHSVKNPQGNMKYGFIVLLVKEKCPNCIHTRAKSQRSRRKDRRILRQRRKRERKIMYIRRRK